MSTDTADKPCAFCGRVSRHSRQCPLMDERRDQRQGVVWTRERLRILADHYPAGGAEEVARLTGLKERQVYMAASLYGIPKESRRRGGAVAPSSPGARPAASNAYGLTDREVSVLRSCAAGRGIKGAAADLGVSPNTVNDYMKAIFKAMGVHNQVVAVLKAERAGLLQGVQV